MLKITVILSTFSFFGDGFLSDKSFVGTLGLMRIIQKEKFILYELKDGSLTHLKMKLPIYNSALLGIDHVVCIGTVFQLSPRCVAQKFLSTALN